MFRKKLQTIEFSPKYLCTCCWSSKPRRNSDVPKCKRSSELRVCKDIELKAIDNGKVPGTPRGSGDGESNSQKGRCL